VKTKNKQWKYLTENALLTTKSDGIKGTSITYFPVTINAEKRTEQQKISSYVTTIANSAIVKVADI
jgi:hypothetical protein